MGLVVELAGSALSVVVLEVGNAESASSTGIMGCDVVCPSSSDPQEQVRLLTSARVHWAVA